MLLRGVKEPSGRLSVISTATVRHAHYSLIQPAQEMLPPSYCACVYTRAFVFKDQTKAWSLNDDIHIGSIYIVYRDLSILHLV